MMDRSRAGRKCRVNQMIRTVRGDLPRFSEGIIRYEMENLGRKLVLVDWCAGFEVLVFPGEIELVAEVPDAVAG
jgi:hypothetical protein